jgi:D-proline reductase (dithiol) PrdB
MTDFANALFVQLFTRIPWLASRWARRHRFVEHIGIPWAPVTKPVSQSVVALVTTAGVHLISQSPFDMEDPDGDPSFREFPTATQRVDLTITHRYYDHSAADRDINVVLPLDRLREISVEGRIGGIAPIVYGFMGHIDGPHLETLMTKTAPEVARRLRSDGAEAVVLSPA